ncbi:MAG: hypothetical protein WCX46_04580 [Candidatus Paceibacterota bacterium]
MIKYPTKEEILSNPPILDEKLIEIVKIWKNVEMKNWNKKENWEQFISLEILTEIISALLKKKAPKFLIGNEYSYTPKHKIITIDIDKPSIISILHELGHHLFGNSELEACRWSIWLFKECFPSSYKKLEWKGHLLIKK